MRRAKPRVAPCTAPTRRRRTGMRQPSPAFTTLWQGLHRPQGNPPAGWWQNQVSSMSGRQPRSSTSRAMSCLVISNSGSAYLPNTTSMSGSSPGMILWVS